MPTPIDDIESLYIRFGLSPNLYDLLLNGQAYLKILEDDGSRLGLANKTFNASVTAALHYLEMDSSAANPTSGDTLRAQLNPNHAHAQSGTDSTIRDRKYCQDISQHLKSLPPKMMAIMTVSRCMGS